MNYIDFFNCFYMAGRAAIIGNKKSRHEIMKFLFESGTANQFKFNIDDSTIDKWTKDESKNNNRNKDWNDLVKYFNEEAFTNSLEKNINKQNYNFLTYHFFKTNNLEIDKKEFFTAISNLFFDIAVNHGYSEHDIFYYYKTTNDKPLYPIYRDNLYKKYKKVFTMAYPENIDFDKIFVCSTISNRQDIRNKRTQQKGKIFLDDISLDNFPMEYRKTILIGNGGMGKTLMLQYLLLKSIKEHDKTGFLPIIIEVRDFNVNEDLLSEIIKNYKKYDENIKDSMIINALKAGKCQILLDGIDEIDPGDIREFHKKLIDITDKYPNSQYLIASRECDNAKQLTGFTMLYILPFDDDQQKRLIENIYKDESEDYKNEVFSYLKKDFLKKHTAFVTNPMLLTYTIKNYPLTKSFVQKHKFFKKAYQTILSGHDDYKDAYDRIFRSVTNPDNFTEVFRELCAITYSDGKKELDSTEFTGYFKKLKSKDSLHDDKMMREKTFLQDACATACMMYEQDYNILYIDEGFQDYFFAEFLYMIDEKDVLKIGEHMQNNVIDNYNSVDAFEMLYAMSKDKIEIDIFLPYLNKIFKNKDDNENFLNFIIKEFKKLQIVYMNVDKINEFENNNNIKLTLQTISNTPRSLIMNAILTILGDNLTNEIIVKENVNCFRVNNYITTTKSFDGEKEITSLSLTKEKANNQIYGEIYSIDTRTLQENTAEYDTLIITLKNSILFNVFLKLKEYVQYLKCRKEELNND